MIKEVRHNTEAGRQVTDLGTAEVKNISEEVQGRGMGVWVREFGEGDKKKENCGEFFYIQLLITMIIALKMKISYLPIGEGKTNNIKNRLPITILIFLNEEKSLED